MLGFKATTDANGTLNAADMLLNVSPALIVYVQYPATRAHSSRTTRQPDVQGPQNSNDMPLRTAQPEVGTPHACVRGTLTALIGPGEYISILICGCMKES